MAPQHRTNVSAPSDPAPHCTSAACPGNHWLFLECVAHAPTGQTQPAAMAGLSHITTVPRLSRTVVSWLTLGRRGSWAADTSTHEGDIAALREGAVVVRIAPRITPS